MKSVVVLVIKDNNNIFSIDGYSNKDGIINII